VTPLPFRQPVRRLVVGTSALLISALVSVSVALSEPLAPCSLASVDTVDTSKWYEVGFDGRHWIRIPNDFRLDPPRKCIDNCGNIWRDGTKQISIYPDYWQNDSGACLDSVGDLALQIQTHLDPDRRINQWLATVVPDLSRALSYNLGLVSSDARDAGLFSTMLNTIRSDDPLKFVMYTPPVLVVSVAPLYPSDRGDLRDTTLVVWTRALVGSDGRIKDVKFISGDHGLKVAAIAAVRKYEFKPAHDRGMPVEAWVDAPVTFRFR